MMGRARHRGLHGHQHIDHERMIALTMIGTGLCRVFIWALLVITYLLHVHFVRHLYSEVAFVSLLSVLALLLTDWGQVAASLAQLTAGHAHHDAEAARREVNIDTDQLAEDLARLAKLHPCPEADQLAEEIRAQIAGTI